MILFEMIGHELPLVLFTVLMQAAVGLLFVYTPAFAKGYKSDSQLKNFGLFSVIALGVAILPSVFHLGDITHALNFAKRLGVFEIDGVWHIGWMNNEVAFAGLAMLFALLLYIKNSKIFLYLALACGILCIFFMAGAYGSMQRTVTTWRFDITLVYFFSSMLFLGGLMYHAFFAVSEHEEKMAFLVGLFGAGVLMTAVVLQTLHLGNAEVAGVINPFDLLGGKYGLYILVGAGLIGASMILWYANNYLLQSSKFVAFAAFVIALVGVGLTRAIFYGLINTHIMH
ncbi:MAG: dimethyl sulfoxide reductase anchor subunit [Campylobacter sp.]|nr:dimethyl sulfoxide reductase anchor subunit [Campylobacter sp.]